MHVLILMCWETKKTEHCGSNGSKHSPNLIYSNFFHACNFCLFVSFQNIWICCIFEWFTLISGFRRDVDEICALVGYYAASCGNCLPTFRDKVSVHLQGSRDQARRCVISHQHRGGSLKSRFSLFVNYWPWSKLIIHENFKAFNFKHTKLHKETYVFLVLCT